ncbi:hypothetical protein ACHAW6_010124 [Cyclotella cf. meneghiniana]
MEEPPRIEHIVSSRGISISDTAAILQAFLATLDNHHFSPKNHGEAEKATVASDSNSWNKPRKSRQEMEEESILKQFDLISKQFETRLVSDDTYERLKMIRDSILGEASGRPVLPSEIVKATKQDNAGIHMNHGVNNQNRDFEEIIDETQQFIEELHEAEQDLSRKEKEKQERKRRQEAKKEKKAAKKAKKEAKRERRDKRKAESANSHDGGKKRVKVEEFSL